MLISFVKNISPLKTIFISFRIDFYKKTQGKILMSLEQTNPYVNKPNYTLVNTSQTFEVKSDDTVSVSYGRTYEYCKKYSSGKRFGAILLAIVTLGLILIAKAMRETCAGRQFVKVDVALLPDQVLEFLKPKNQPVIDEKMRIYADAMIKRSVTVDTELIFDGCSSAGVDFTKDHLIQQIARKHDHIVNCIKTILQKHMGAQFNEQEFYEHVDDYLNKILDIMSITTLDLEEEENILFGDNIDQETEQRTPEGETRLQVLEREFEELRQQQQKDREKFDKEQAAKRAASDAKFAEEMAKVKAAQDESQRSQLAFIDRAKEELYNQHPEVRETQTP